MPPTLPRSLGDDSDFSRPSFPVPLIIFLSIAGVFILCVVTTCIHSYNYKKRMWLGYYSRPLPRGTHMASTKGCPDDRSYLLSAPPPYPGVEDFERHHHRSHSPAFGNGRGGMHGDGGDVAFGGHHSGGHGDSGSGSGGMSSSGARGTSS